MNLCHDCNSSYATPGTCNCFAPGGKRYVAPTITWPSHPWYPNATPWYPASPMYPWTTWTITAAEIDGIGNASYMVSGQLPLTST